MRRAPSLEAPQRATHLADPIHPPPPPSPFCSEAERTPVWLMRQAGRYMAAFREYSDRLGFRERSETASIAIELSLQPWRAFQTDGVIMFSDILTPLPALGIEFDVIKGKGPRIDSPISRWGPGGRRRCGGEGMARGRRAGMQARPPRSDPWHSPAPPPHGS